MLRGLEDRTLLLQLPAGISHRTWVVPTGFTVGPQAIDDVSSITKKLPTLAAPFSAVSSRLDLANVSSSSRSSARPF
jgi:hypothetical protein